MALPEISIGGGLLGEALLDSVEIVQELNTHWWCTVVCRQTLEERIPIEQLVGVAVEVKITDGSGTEHVQFSGFLQDVALRYEVGGSYRARLVAVSTSLSSRTEVKRAKIPETRVYRDLWMSVGTDVQNGSYFVSFPVSSGIIDYEEYYSIPAEWALASDDHLKQLTAFAEECRHRLHDGLLIIKPGPNRGTAI